ncbi:MAG: HD domain-containing protein [Rhodocyclaceae bacterium]|nr:HD domain-containing protein [Rhodocyclaceae bacterium]
MSDVQIAPFGTLTEITLSDADVPTRSDPPLRLPRAQLEHERVEREAAFSQMYRLVDDFHRVRCERDAAFRALTRAHHETLFRLAHAAEFKEGDSGVRIVRIGALSAILARELGRPRTWCDMLLHAAPMLDVGKIAVPQDILRGTAEPGDVERRLLNSHTEIGARILGGSDIPVLNMASEIALGHHEHWDGSGYPAGLAGNQVPLAARIVAVIDYFDERTMARGRVAQRSDEVVREEIRQARGRRFDPEIVDVFVANLERLASARDFVTDQRLGSRGRNWEGDWWTVF